MAVDYALIACENERKYGTEIDNYGPKLLADRYSDRAHFVFELLQNAEDALRERLDLASNSTLPRAAKFILFKDRLEFRHFGIPFAEKDVRAICDIARSSKQKTSSAIGRFGIGFKSVYAFTRSPEIHSCGESFVIESLVRPSAVPRKQGAEGETLIVLPFNHTETSSGESHDIIAERLRELGPRTLLFLRCLDEVDWQIEGGGFGRYLRKPKKEAEGVERITLVCDERGKAKMEENWLVFSRPVTVENGTSVRVEIAYQLQPTKENRRAQIQRVKVSRLCVYFATKLDTYLGFLVQGPFHLTPSRETIRENDKWNKALAKEVGKLTADSLFKLEEMGLLSVSALDAMPLERESFEKETDKLFLPVYDAVLQALKRHTLIPSIGKSFVCGMNGVLVRGRELADLFKPAQLKLLLGSEEERQWISPDITDKKSTQRLHSYLRDAVGADEVDAENLVSRLDDSFLQAQKVDWFGRFYRFLLKPRNQNLLSEGGGLLEKPIIRLADGSNVVPFGSDGANAFLASDGEIGPKSVHPKLAKGESLKFLRKLGIRERDSVAKVLEDILPQYESDDTPDETEHLKNLRRIFHALEQKECLDHEKLIDKLCETAFLRATNAKNGKSEFRSPASLLYFKSSDLSEYFKDQDDCWFLAEQSLSKKRHQWIARLGVGNLPALDPTDEAKRRHLEEIASDVPRKRVEAYTDHHLHGLDNVLKRIRKQSKVQTKQAVKLSRIVWEIMARVADDDDGRFLRGCLKWKRPHRRLLEEEPFDAYFVERLRDEAWLPDRKGCFRKPREMHEQELPSRFERNRRLCEAMQFQTPLLEKFKDAGISAKETKLVEMARIDPQFADDFYRNWKKRGYASATPTVLEKVLPSQTESRQLSREVAPVIEAAATEIPSNLTERSREQAAISESDATAIGEKGNGSPRTDHLQTRIRAVAGTKNESTPESLEMSESRSRVDESGVAAVKAFEERAGRSVTEMPHNHPGFDLESRTRGSAGLRYIEVKSTGADWNGVLLSATQFRAAQQLGEQYWLYVVENADSAMPKVYAIQNPVGLTEKFVFDTGWKSIAMALQEI